MAIDQLQQLQEIIYEWFKDYDDEVVVNFIYSFTYRKSATAGDGTSELIDKFLKENDLVEAYINYYLDIEQPKDFFRRCASSDVQLINNINLALLNLSYDRLKKITSGRRLAIIQQKLDEQKSPKKKRIVKPKQLTNQNFNKIKDALVATFDALNENEHYMFSKEEDAQFISIIKKLKNN